MTHIIGDDGDDEILCKHGIGHSAEVHSCDGCCSSDEELMRELREAECHSVPAVASDKQGALSETCDIAEVKG